MKKLSKLTVILILALSFVFVFAACDLLSGYDNGGSGGGGSTDPDPNLTQLAAPRLNFVDVHGNERIVFDDIEGARDFEFMARYVNAPEGQYVVNQTLRREQHANAEGQIERTLTENFQRGRDYMVFVRANAAPGGNFSSSIRVGIPIRLTQEETLQVGAVDRDSITFDQETRTFAWAPVENATSYGLTISFGGNSFPETIVTGSSLILTPTDLSAIPVGQFQMTVQGRRMHENGWQVIRGESATATFTREQEQNNDIEQRRNAFRQWEGNAKFAVGLSLPGFTAPTVNSIEAVDIVPGAAGRSIVTVFVTHSNNMVGSVSYDVPAITGADTQARLNAAVLGMTQANRVAGSDVFTARNPAAPAGMVTDLRNSPALTAGEFRNVAPGFEVIQEFVNTPSPTGTRAYIVGGLVRTADGGFFSLNSSVVHNAGDARTNEQLWGALAAGTGVASITENRWQEFTGMQDFMALKETLWPTQEEGRAFAAPH